MYLMKAYQNYLFDLYGTLVDIHTDEDDLLLWQRLSVLMGTEGVFLTPQRLKEIYASEIKRREADAKNQRGIGAEIDIGPVFASMYAEAGVTADAEKIAHLAGMFRILSIEKLRLFPGTTEMLDRLRRQGKRIYLLSNAQVLFTLPELRALDLLPYFDGIVISSQEGLKKPDGRLYKLILDRYGLCPKETVMVGNDDRADCWGAHDAGLDSMYVYTEQSPVKTKSLPPNCRILDDISQVF